jgi:hypothetical protein
MMASQDQDRFPDIHLLNPYLGGPVCRSTDRPMYMTEEIRFVRCSACKSAWTKYTGRALRRMIGAGRPLE